MFETLKRLHKAGELTNDALEKAVRLGWITEEQMQEIKGGSSHEKNIG